MINRNSIEESVLVMTAFKAHHRKVICKKKLAHNLMGNHSRPREMIGNGG